MSRKERRLAKKNRRAGSSRKAMPAMAAQQLFNEALQAFQEGSFVDAALKADQLIASAPESAHLFQLRGMISLNQRNFSNAISYFKKGLSAEPNSADLCDVLGTALSEMGQLDEAIASYRRALLNDARNPGTFYNLGSALQKNEYWEKSEKAYRDSLIYRPDDLTTQLNLAEVLTAQEKFEDAENIYRKLIDANDQFIDGYRMLGECFMNARKWEEALSLADDAISAGLQDAEILTLKGYALGAMMRLEEAELMTRKALELDADNSQAQIAFSILCFYQENWPDAWKYYEARWGLPNQHRRPFTQVEWNGEPLTGQKILIWGEQGVGDEVLYATMLFDVMALGADVAFEMDARLVPLFERSMTGMKCFPRSTQPDAELQNIDFDYQTPIASLGQHLRKNEASFGDGASFLRSDKKKTQKFRKKYKSGNDLIVGIAWYSSDGRGLSKSMSLMDLKPLFEVSGVQFVDLQYGDKAQERQAFEEATGFNLIHDQDVDQMQSLDDFAAQIAALDLVISVSNTTVHMAGALGVPTLVLLGSAPMQRWLMDRTDSPWYSCVEVIRKRTEDDTPYVVEAVKKRLQNFKI